MSEIKHFSDIQKINTIINEIDSDRILIIIDSNVNDLYLDLIDPKNGVDIYIAPGGEDCKKLSEVEKACEFFLERGIHRKAHLFAIGGGACSDFAGLVASMLLRGISWSVIPTTLLSMIDASIGGKVAVNSAFGKNLIGAFHLPDNIYICSEFLQSLPEDHFISGLGELAKYFFLDEEVFNLINNEASFDEITIRCARYKQEIVDQDFKEGGIRKILNLGHTLGHAIEKVYELPHGVAVFWGLKLIFNIFQRDEESEFLNQFAHVFGLNALMCPWQDNLPIDELMEYVAKDKKVVANNTIEVILPSGIGKPIIQEVSLDEIRKRLMEYAHGKGATKDFIKKIRVPSSKSFANRALVLAAIYPQDIELLDLPESTDVIHMLNCLGHIGLQINKEGRSVTIKGSFPACEIETDEVINLVSGDGGTTNRFLIPLLSLGNNKYNLIPSEKMFDRPMDELEKALDELDVEVLRDEDNWFQVQGPINISKGVYEVDCTRSTQFATGLAMALSPNDIDVEPVNMSTSRPYWEMTLNLIERFKSGEQVFEVPVDFSSLGYPLAYACMSGPVLVENCKGIDRFQADSQFISLLEELGGDFDFTKDGLLFNGVENLNGFEIDCRDCPDLIPTLCFLASYADGVSIIRSVEVLVHKESDRLNAVMDLMELYDIKHHYDEENDLLEIEGRKADGRVVDITPPRDHRMVMVSYLYQIVNGGGKLENTECVEKSFPNFFEVIN
ncbi:3-dehydroquinate synthase family protein [Halobacteriovorax sp.]|uniref:3-dehydroquinate synthase family protein n=1 Tax=Halobacteriovorax sp. TaxID=2020862 RepID=UPI003AF2CF67